MECCKLARFMKSRIAASRRRFIAASLFTLVSSTFGDTFTFSTGNPDGRIAVGSRPESPGIVEIEAADDFVLTQPTSLSSASFIGLLPSGATAADISGVAVEIYRVFPKDSDTGRTPQVPTRNNSPSDVAFDSRSAPGSLTFTAGTLGPFSAGNSVLNGIHPAPNQNTGGEGPVTGQEVQFNVTFTTPLDLPADHYFFVPQVQLTTGNFLWLSTPKPGTPFPAGFTDLQAWIRNGNLDPDWLRIGTDIVGPGANGTPAPTFNMAFSLNGETVPDSGTTIGLIAFTFAGIAVGQRAMRKGLALA